jgi:hypothetical protein
MGALEPRVRRRRAAGLGGAGRADFDLGIVAGEAFVVLRVDEAAPGVPLTLQVLGPEFLDESKT